MSNEAAYWFIRCSDEKPLGAMARRKFFAWLTRSPENIAELLLIASLDHRLTKRKLIAKIAAMDETNVIQLHLRQQGRPRPRRHEPANAPEYKASRWSRAFKARAWKFAAVAAAVAAVAIGVVTRTEFVGEAQTYMPEKVVQTTKANESMRRNLHDGSVVHVDARTELKVEFTDDARIVYLYSGQAMFEVQKDPKRKFIVRTPTVDVTAVGTKFSVAVDEKVRTIVSEGKVVVTRRGVPAREGGDVAYVTVNERLDVADGELGSLSLLKVDPVNAERKMQWINGRVAVGKETYGEVAKEFNRRNVVQIYIEDPSIANKPAKAYSFESDKPASFAKFLAQNETGLAVEETKTTIVLRPKRR